MMCYMILKDTDSNVDDREISMEKQNAVINVNVDAKLKNDANTVLKELGLNMSSAINMFLVQVVKKNGIPFEIINNDRAR